MGRSLKSTHDLVGAKGDFLLITDSMGRDWVGAAANANELGGGIRLKVATVDTQPVHGKDIGYIDHNDRCQALSQIRAGGAVLVRPDNMVAWHTVSKSKNRGAELLEALKEVTENGTKATKATQNGVSHISAAASTKLEFVKGKINF